MLPNARVSHWIYHHHRFYTTYEAKVQLFNFIKTIFSIILLVNTKLNYNVLMLLKRCRNTIRFLVQKFSRWTGFVYRIVSVLL